MDRIETCDELRAEWIAAGRLADIESEHPEWLEAVRAWREPRAEIESRSRRSTCIILDKEADDATIAKWIGDMFTKRSGPPSNQKRTDRVMA